MNKGLLVGGAMALGIVLVLGVLFPKGNTVVERVVENLGVSAGPEKTDHHMFYASFGQGGAFRLATTASAFTMSDVQMRENSLISIEPVAADGKSAALTLTTPASTTWSSLAKVGVMQSWIIDNTHGSAATTTTITAGTGVDIDGTSANDDVINGGTAGLLSCWRTYNSDVRCIVEEMVDAG